jgi:hypothetical protein
LSLLRVLRGARIPKAKHTYPSTTRNPYYAGLNQDYRWFRQDELVRRCTQANAYFATQCGFKTRSDDKQLKETVDTVNKRVNMDKILYTAQVKRSIYGSAGFEVVTDRNGLPTRLLELNSPSLKPELDENWTLTGYTYKGQRGFYQPEEVLYFINLGLEADMIGLSDLEPIRQVCSARHELLRENFAEIARSLWAPYVVLKADTSGLPVDEAESVVEELAEVARAGKSIAVNEAVEAQVVHITPDIAGLNVLLGKLEEAILAGLGTPRLLLGRRVENRATAYAELEAYVDGVVGGIQRYLRREIEHQWYRRIGEAVGSSSEVKHVWNPVRAYDLYELASAVASLWGSHGQGAIGGDTDRVWTLMGWEAEQDE